MLEISESYFGSMASQFSQSGCMFRRLDPLRVEVWGEDISEHYLLCYDERQGHLLDVFYIPFDTQTE